VNDRPIKVAAKYAKTFDALVLGNEGSLSGAIDLVNEIVAGHSDAAVNSPPKDPVSAAAD